MVVVPGSERGDFTRLANPCEEYLWHRLQSTLASNARMVNALRAVMHAEPEEAGRQLSAAMNDLQQADAWLANHEKAIARRCLDIVQHHPGHAAAKIREVFEI